MPLHVLRCFERRVAARHLVDLGQEGTILPGATRPSLCRDVWESFWDVEAPGCAAPQGGCQRYRAAIPASRPRGGVRGAAERRITLFHNAAAIGQERSHRLKDFRCFTLFKIG